MTEDHSAAVSKFEDRSFLDVLKSMVGEVFLIANNESFEEGALGPQMRTDFYRAKFLGLGRDYLILAIHFKHGDGKHAEKETVRQFLPLDRVKRVSMLRDQPILHV